MQFMNSSSDSLVKNLSDNNFKYLPEEFIGEFLKLVKQKGFYPYEYMDSFKKFSENKLPDRSKFFSSLKRDVLLLADVFEKFISTCLDYYGLNPCHYFSFPGLSWNAILKMTGTELELISDIDMHLFIENGMRGGVSYIPKRYSKANNKYIKCYDSSKESKYIAYLDANNLYGWAISQYLRRSGFKWFNQKD